LRRDRHGTEFALAAIPLGGYVRMLDEREPGTIETERRPGDVSFNDLSVWWRMAIAFGGPVANFILAIVVYWLLFVAGTTTLAPMLGAPAEDSAIARAGIPAGWEIAAVDGVETPGWQQVTMTLAGRLGDSGSIEIDARRPGSATAQSFQLPIADWHRGEDEPDLLGSLGIVPAMPPVVGEVLPDGPASRAGFRTWDRVVAVDGETIDTWVEWVEAVQQAPDRSLRVTVDRNGAEVQLSVLPDARPGAGDAALGYVGLAPYTNEIRYGPLEAVSRSLGETRDKTVLTLGLLRKMVVGDVSMKNLSGPITIAKVAGDSARSGWRFFLSVLALLSISLGVLNLLPIPILDGGHILFCAVEAATGRPVPEQAQAIGTQVGLFLVAGLMILALYNDISRLF
jgi:regulator of sigma E protease